MDISKKGLRQIRTVDTRSPSGRSRNKTTSSGFSNRTTGKRTSCSSITIGTGRKEGSSSRFGHRISRMRNSCSSNSAGTCLKTATSSRFTDRTSRKRTRCSSISIGTSSKKVTSSSVERTGTDCENQSATVFIIRNHGSEVLNRRDQRVFFPLEVARYLKARSRQRKKNSLAPRVLLS